RTIAVHNLPPSATILNAPTDSGEGTGITLGSSVSDPSPVDTFAYAWKVTKNGASFATGADATFAFTPDDDGTYVATLVVTDDDGGIGSDVRTITVHNVSPTATINGASTDSDEGTGISLGSSVSDPSPVDTFTYAWKVTKNGASF